MRMVWIGFLSLWGCISLQAAAINEDEKKSSEIRDIMWNSGDHDFEVTVAPEKWMDKEAVVIAKAISLSYRKSVMAANINFDNYVHYRLKLLTRQAVERYAQFSIPENGSYRGIRYTYYAGFKVIKPDGTEIEVPMEDAVLEKRELNRASLNLFKIAIPNLEVGDILDYYVAEEQDVTVSGVRYYTFDPVIFELNGDYPVMKQKISFDVLRKCYINLRSLNGAPEFALVADDDEDKRTYYLEDADRESIDDIRWLFPYRELPTIKFKVVYASNSVAGVLPVFLGSPGVLKSDVGKSEVRDLLEYMFGAYVNTADVMELKKYMKKHYRKEKNADTLARAAFYRARYQTRIADAETGFLFRNQPTNPTENQVRNLGLLSTFYRVAEIPHEVIIGVSREISDLEDLILENELTFMIKVNTPRPFYISDFDNFTIPGEIDPDLQGQQVYTANGMAPPSLWRLQEITLPVVPHTVNTIVTQYHLQVADADAGTLTLDVAKSVQGAGKKFFQNQLMDLYSYLFEEAPEKDRWQDNAKLSKKVMQYRNEYMRTRDERVTGAIKQMLEDDLIGVKINDVQDAAVTQTGRFEHAPEFMYACQAQVQDVMKRAGPNYLIDIGKFIEGQVHIRQEERGRPYNIYMPYARSFQYEIFVDIPEGYTVQGLGKLNMRVENSTGGFTSTARIEGTQLIIDTYKYYSSNYEDKAHWEDIMAFLDAAHAFSQLQILLRKT